MPKLLNLRTDRVLGIGAAAVALMFASTASADVITFDSTLASPNTNPANTTNNPSFYNGSGNPQGGWTVSNGSGIELGLRAKLRQVNSAIDSPTNDYYVPPGLQTIPSPSTRAAWNYEFSINLRPNGAGGLTLSDITALLSITDLNTGATATVDPLTYWTDDTGFGSGLGGASGLTSTGKHSPETGGDWGAQNSENPMFGDFPLSNPLACTLCEAFNPNAAHTYQINLAVQRGVNVLASDTINVHVTPEPSSVLLLLTIAGGAFLARRRRLAA